MNPEASEALRQYLHFWTRFRREVASGTIKADSGIHWPHVGAESVVVCDFASREAALHRADSMILELELQLIALEPAPV